MILHSRSEEATGSMQVELPGLGILDFHCDGGGIDLLTDLGEDRHYPGHPLARSIFPIIQFVEWDGGFAIAEERGEEVFYLSSKTLNLERLLRLERLEWIESGSKFVHFHAPPVCEDLYIVYDSGIARASPGRRIVWHVHPESTPLFFNYLSDGVLHLNSGPGDEVLLGNGDGAQILSL